MDRKCENQKRSKPGLWRTLGAAAVLVGLLSGIGCASTRNHDFQSIDRKVARAAYDAGYQELERKKEKLYKIQDIILYDIESGLLAFYSENYESAIRHFFLAEDNIERFYSITISEQVASFIQNDSVLMYDVLWYEDLYINVFLSLSFLALQRFDSALVEIRKLNTKMNTFEDRYYRTVQAINTQKDRTVSIDIDAYSPYDSPFIRFLGSVLYRATGDYDNARIDRDALFVAHEAQQGFERLPASFSDPGAKNKHAVVVFARRTPIKEQINVSYVANSRGVGVYVSDNSYADYIQAVSTTQTILHSTLGPAFSLHFATPVLAYRPSEIAYIQCFINGERQYNPILLDDLVHEFSSEFDARLPLIFARSLSSALAKAIASMAVRATAQQLSSSDNEFALLAWLGSITLDTVIAANVYADIRISRYFPGAVFAGDYLLSEEENTLRIEYYNRFGVLLDAETKIVSSKLPLTLFINLQ